MFESCRNELKSCQHFPHWDSQARCVARYFLHLQQCSTLKTAGRTKKIFGIFAEHNFFGGGSLRWNLMFFILPGKLKIISKICFFLIIFSLEKWKKEREISIAEHYSISFSYQYNVFLFRWVLSLFDQPCFLFILLGFFDQLYLRRKTKKEKLRKTQTIRKALKW